MLAHILAVLVGTSSVGLYIAAFLLPEIHRKQDFIWSGVGLFYALTLWVYARQELGGILVGQIASVALLGWLGWQTIALRRQLIPVSQQPPIPETTKPPARLGVNRSTAIATQPTAKVATPARSAPPAVPTPDPNPIGRSPSSQKAVPSEKAPQPPNPSPIGRSPSSPKTTPVESNLPVDRPPSTPPASSQPTTANDVAEPTLRVDVVEATDQAWIKLEVKSASPPKPLGTAVKPPLPTPSSPTIINPEPQPLLASTTEDRSGDRSTKAPTDSTPSTVRSDGEDREEPMGNRA